MKLSDLPVRRVSPLDEKPAELARAPTKRTGHGIVIKLALSGGDFEAVEAEQIDLGNLRGMFCVHPRRAEARHVNTVVMNWVVTHIASGRALAYGYTKEDAIDEAARQIKRVGSGALRRLTIHHTVAAKRHDAHAREPRQTALFRETAAIDRPSLTTPQQQNKGTT